MWEYNDEAKVTYSLAISLGFVLTLYFLLKMNYFSEYLFINIELNKYLLRKKVSLNDLN